MSAQPSLCTWLVALLAWSRHMRVRSSGASKCTGAIVYTCALLQAYFQFPISRGAAAITNLQSRPCGRRTRPIVLGLFLRLPRSSKLVARHRDASKCTDALALACTDVCCYVLF